MKLYDWLEEQPFTLSMSSGFFSFFAHAGMLAALVDRGLKPAKLTGSSAGALVGGCYASGCSIDELKEQLFEKQVYLQTQLEFDLNNKNNKQQNDPSNFIRIGFASMSEHELREGLNLIVTELYGTGFKV